MQARCTTQQAHAGAMHTCARARAVLTCADGRAADKLHIKQGARRHHRLQAHIKRVSDDAASISDMAEPLRAAAHAPVLPCRALPCAAVPAALPRARHRGAARRTCHTVMPGPRFIHAACAAMSGSLLLNIKNLAGRQAGMIGMTDREAGRQAAAALLRHSQVQTRPPSALASGRAAGTTARWCSACGGRISAATTAAAARRPGAAAWGPLLTSIEGSPPPPRWQPPAGSSAGAVMRAPRAARPALPPDRHSQQAAAACMCAAAAAVTPA